MAGQNGNFALLTAFAFSAKRETSVLQRMPGGMPRASVGKSKRLRRAFHAAVLRRAAAKVMYGGARRPSLLQSAAVRFYRFGEGQDTCIGYPAMQAAAVWRCSS